MIQVTNIKTNIMQTLAGNTNSIQCDNFNDYILAHAHLFYHQNTYVQ